MKREVKKKSEKLIHSFLLMKNLVHVKKYDQLFHIQHTILLIWKQYKSQVNTGIDGITKLSLLLLSLSLVFLCLSVCLSVCLFFSLSVFLSLSVCVFLGIHHPIQSGIVFLFSFFFFFLLLEDRIFVGKFDVGNGFMADLPFLALYSASSIIFNYLVQIWWPEEYRSIAKLIIFVPLQLNSDISCYFLGIIIQAIVGVYLAGWIEKKGGMVAARVTLAVFIVFFLCLYATQVGLLLTPARK